MASPVAAFVDALGIHAPSFADIQTYLVQQFEAIYGADSYLGNDSQDGQWIGTIAQAISDCNAAAVASYNAFSPSTAQGNGLSSVVKINGLTRLPGSFSTATLTVTGVANTPITNGIAQDASGNQWALPNLVTIPLAGNINVLATCTTLGAVTAAANTINSIATPVSGWQTVNNASSATPGNGVETDAALRIRQSNSVAEPSQDVFSGIVAAIAQVVGVTRIAPYENNTNSINSNGVPAGNLAFVVEGGNLLAIATAIASKIPPGIPTYANTAVGQGQQNFTITDAAGYSKLVNFMTPLQSRIDVALTIHGLNGWSTATEAIIQAALVAYINALPIGQNVSYTQLFPVAYLPGTQYAGTFNITDMTIAKNEGATQRTDMTMNYAEAPIADLLHITFTIV